MRQRSTPPMIICGSVSPGYERNLLQEVKGIYAQYLEEVKSGSSGLYDQEDWIKFRLPGKTTGRGAGDNFTVFKGEDNFLFEYGKVWFTGTPGAFLTGVFNFKPVRNGLRFFYLEPSDPLDDELIFPVTWEIVSSDPGEKMPALPEY